MGVIVGKTRDGGNYFGDRPMAEPLYPWLYGNGWRIGPFTSNDEDRRRAEETWAQIQAEQAMPPAVPNDPRLNVPPSVPFRPGANVAEETPTGIRSIMMGEGDPVAASEPPPPQESKGSFIDWWLGQNKPPSLPEEAPVPTPRPVEATPDAETEVAAPEAPQQDIGTLKQALKEYFPELNRAPSDQQIAADAEAERQRKRTGLLAQLAFFSGITSGAGGPWKDVGKGLAAAGQFYDEGYERYHRTLQDNADREMKMRSAEYDRDVSLTNAAIKLYTSKVKPNDDAMDKRREERLDYFKQTKPDDSSDPEVFKAWRRRYEHYLETGEILPEDAIDVRGE